MQDSWSPRGRRKGETHLAFKLRTNGIPSLDKKSVRSYKRAVFWAQKGSWFPKAILGLSNSFIDVTLVATLIFSIVAIAVWACQGPPILCSIAWWLAGALFSIPVCAFLCFIAHGDEILVWKRTPYHLYRGKVPDSVQVELQRVDELLPGAKKSIESLGFDPFAVVRENGEEEYVAQWNEQGFTDF